MDQRGAVEFVLGLAQEHHEADVDLVPEGVKACRCVCLMAA